MVVWSLPGRVLFYPAAWQVTTDLHMPELKESEDSSLYHCFQKKAVNCGKKGWNGLKEG